MLLPKTVTVAPEVEMEEAFRAPTETEPVRDRRAMLPEVSPDEETEEMRLTEVALMSVAASSPMNPEEAAEVEVVEVTRSLLKLREPAELAAKIVPPLPPEDAVRMSPMFKPPEEEPVTTTGPELLAVLEVTI